MTHHQFHPYPVAVHALLQGLVIDSNPEVGRGRTQIDRGTAPLGAVEGDDHRSLGHAAVDLVGLDLLHDLLHIQEALPVVTGDVNPGDVGCLICRQQLEQRGKNAVLPRLGELAHGLKRPAAVAGHGYAHAHVPEEIILPGLVTDADIRKPQHPVITQQAIPGVLEELRVQAQILPDHFGRVLLLH